MPDRSLPHPGVVDVTRVGRKIAKRSDSPAPTMPFRFQVGSVDSVGTAPTGESVCNVRVGTAGHPDAVVYPLLRYAETPTPVAPGDKVVVMWIGGDPSVIAKYVP